MERAPNSGPKSIPESDDFRKGYTFPPHPSGSRWDLTPDGYEGEDGRAYFANGTLDREAMMAPDDRDFGMDSRILDRRYLEWAEMADEMRTRQEDPANPTEPLANPES